MASPPGLFYAYAKESIENKHWRYLIVFESRAIADEWWRKVSNAPEFSYISRESLQLFSMSQQKNLIVTSVMNKGCAADLIDKVFFTLLEDRDSRRLSVAPPVHYTDHKSGNKFFVRSIIKPDTFWFWDQSLRRIIASSTRRSSFTISVADSSLRQRGGVIMIGSDAISIAAPDSQEITAANFNCTCKQTDGDGKKATAPCAYHAAHAPATPFLFSDFDRGFAIDYNDAEGMKPGEAPLRKNQAVVGGEPWELI